MSARIIHFIKYNNAFTLALAFLLLSTSTIFAANEDLRKTIVDSQQQIVAVDNSYIRNVDLDTYDPAVAIMSVAEDELNFYVTYRINTIEIVDGVWTEVSNEEVLTVAKIQLGDRDLGLYVAEELAELTAYTLAHLREVQEIERTIGSVDRVVQTEYSGLVGRMFDPELATFIGYEPVVPEEQKPLEELQNGLIAAAIGAEQEEENTEEPPENETDQNDEDTSPPVIELLGPSPFEVLLGATFVDPGVTAYDDRDGDLSSAISMTSDVNTSVGGSYSIHYLAVDTAGNRATATRQVLVNEVTAVTDTDPPILQLKGETDIELMVGDTYSEAGATAVDDTDGEISLNIKIEGGVNTTQPGVYILTYSVSDAAGNTTKEDRRVTVVTQSEPLPEVPNTVE